MKYIYTVMLTISMIAPIQGMEKETANNHAQYNVSKPFKIAQTGSLEIHTNNEKLRIIAKTEQTTIGKKISATLTSLAERTKPTKLLSEFIRGSVNNHSELRTITILALMEITKRVELPYTIEQDENHTHIKIITQTNLDEIGINLKELIISIPSSISVLAQGTGPIDFTSDYAHVDARAREIGFNTYDQKESLHYFSFDKTIGNRDNERTIMPLVVLESKSNIRINQAQKSTEL